jgi:hypothetical protein
VLRFIIMGFSESPGDWAPSPQVTARDTRTGAILLDMAGGHCWEMNGTGATMWNLLVELQSATQAIAKIGEVLPDAPDRAAEDMAAFVQQLARLGMVVPVPRPPSEG